MAAARPVLKNTAYSEEKTDILALVRSRERKVAVQANIFSW